MKKIILFILLFLACLVVKAQRSVTTKVTAKIPNALQLTVSAGTTVAFDFSNNISALTTGVEKLNAVTLTYNSNKPWFLDINATADNFSGGDGANPMPSSIIQFRNSDNGDYSPLSSTAASLSGTTGSKNPKGSSTVGVDLKVTPGVKYPPADYTIGITYTISNI